MGDTEVTATPSAKTRFFPPRWIPCGRFALLWAAVLAIGAGLVFGWDWLVAAGFAPLVVSALPCAAMCALGLCFMRGNAKSCHDEDKTKSKAADLTSSHAQGRP
jgi:hypothetical protein